jgi:type II secretory pathway component PulK
VLRALDENIDETTAETLVNERVETPFEDSEAFLDRLKNLIGDNEEFSSEIKPLIGVSSRYYLSETKVLIENSVQQLSSLLYKGDQGVYTLSRTIGLY